MMTTDNDFSKKQSRACSLDSETRHFKVWHLGDLGGIIVKDFKDWLLQQISIRVWTHHIQVFLLMVFTCPNPNPTLLERYIVYWAYPHTYTYRHMYSCPFSISFITALLKGQLRTSGHFPELVRRLNKYHWKIGQGGGEANLHMMVEKHCCFASLHSSFVTSICSTYYCITAWFWILSSVALRLRCEICHFRWVGAPISFKISLCFSNPSTPGIIFHSCTGLGLNKINESILQSSILYKTSPMPTERQGIKCKMEKNKLRIPVLRTGIFTGRGVVQKISSFKNFHPGWLRWEEFAIAALGGVLVW